MTYSQHLCAVFVSATNIKYKWFYLTFAKRRKFSKPCNCRDSLAGQI